MDSGLLAFHERFGATEMSVPNGLRFAQTWAKLIWTGLIEQVGSGSFMNGFLHLFGEDNRELDTVLDHWNFLFPYTLERWVIGRNAYGCLLVLESPSQRGTMARVGYLNTLEVSYFTDEHLDLLGLVGNWLPNNRLPGFLDDNVYRRTTSAILPNEMLGIIEPLSLGGTFSIDNFQIEKIEGYFADTGSVYSKHLPSDDSLL